MNYAQIRKLDVANGIGLRTTVFVSGCYHQCFNCFNPDYQDFKYGDIWTNKETKILIEEVQKPNSYGLSFVGGEPMEHSEELLDIITQVKPYMREDQTIWLWSGYTFEQIINSKNKKALLEIIDVLIDGKFIESQKDLNLKFKGSHNQRIINVGQSLKNNKIIILDI